MLLPSSRSPLLTGHIRGRILAKTVQRLAHTEMNRPMGAHGGLLRQLWFRGLRLSCPGPTGTNLISIRVAARLGRSGPAGYHAMETLIYLIRHNAPFRSPVQMFSGKSGRTWRGKKEISHAAIKPHFFSQGTKSSHAYHASEFTACRLESREGSARRTGPAACNSLEAPIHMHA